MSRLQSQSMIAVHVDIDKLALIFLDQVLNREASVAKNFSTGYPCYYPGFQADLGSVACYHGFTVQEPELTRLKLAQVCQLELQSHPMTTV